jgi:hypothetical protein
MDDYTTRARTIIVVVFVLVFVIAVGGTLWLMGHH